MRTAVLLLVLAAAPSAQLDLPGKRPPSRRSPQSELVPPDPPHGDLAGGDAPPLDLPAGAGPAPAPAVPAPGLPAASGPEASARAVFAALARERGPGPAAQAVETLLALGPTVLPVVRAQLASDHGPTLLAAGRVCLIAGDGEARAAVAERLRRAIPSEAVPLVDELLSRDPVLASPDFLVALLDHPTPLVRTGAAAALAQRLESVPLASLGPALESKRTVTRSAAVELLAHTSEPIGWSLLAARLGDSSAQVARRAADLLADIEAAEPLLEERAFPTDLRPNPLAWSRARAYALLGLVQREELTGRALLEGPVPERRIDSLRVGFANAEPLVAGACAVALARIGFRSGPSRVGTWLDREVPHQLVRCGTGAEFHSDFSALERPALRALALLSGESYGVDGEGWRRWWVENASSFKARHAVIEPGEDAARVLRVLFRDEHGLSTALLGPEATAPRDGGRTLRLDAGAAEALLARLEEAGVFGPARLPNGTLEARACDLAVAVGDQEKRFASAGRGGQAWWPELRSALEDLAEANLWQLWYDPGVTSAGAWWDAEHGHWAGLTPLERRRALVELLLTTTRGVGGTARDERIAELQRLYADAGVPAAADFEPLLALLAGESLFGPRAEALCELARITLGAAGDESPEAAPRERLFQFLLEHYGPEADASLARVASELSVPTLRALAARDDPRSRVLAAAGLVRAEGCLEDVRALLADPDPGVARAVLLAFLSNPLALENAREFARDLEARARESAPETRIAALAVLARLGGPGVNDLALEAVADADPLVQQSGVAALAQLADPRNASLLASLLARGPGSPLFADARQGLARLGAVGREECLRLARSSGAKARREATLLLAEMLAPEAAALLLTQLEETPSDERIAWELSVLSGLDLASEEHPDQAAQTWWDLVVHDDPLAWLLAAAERADVPAPARTALVDPDGAPDLTPEGAAFLLALAAAEAPQLAERAARELELRLGVEVRRPTSPSQRGRFLEELRAEVRSRLGE